jgi:DNA-binding transcriptional LysR family regulator
MDWNDVRYFLALARLGSVRAAGASLRVSHSTVARRVEALEERVAARLFDRTRDGYALTAVGRQMLPSAERIEQEMSALERGLVGQDERLAGTVVVTCCDGFVAGLVLRELASFCAAHPEIELAMNVDARPFDLAKREADLAIRALLVGTQPPEHLIGRKLAPLVLASYVALAHEARLDPERAGSRPRWIGFDQRDVHETMIARSSHPTVAPWGAFGSLELVVQAAREGLGLAMLPTYVGDRDPALRRLTRPDLRHAADLWLLSHPDLRDNARIQATRASIAEAFETHAALFRGESPGGASMHPAVSKSVQRESPSRS